ncbi:MAG: putative porin [Verrucomicrobia bacterium]|nr:putative porin [Verrucomicrobiota bacterium]
MKKWLLGMVAAVVMMPAAHAGDEGASWADTTSLSGDVRVRHEYFDIEGKDARNRWRVRARLALKAKPTDELTIAMRLASGSSDPVSSNQTLDDGFSSKEIDLDRAYFDWHPEALGGVSLLGGKIKNPFYDMKGIVWDSDLNPEGLAVTHALEMDAVDLNLAAAALSAEERSADDDTFLYGLEASATAKVSDGVKVTGGASYFMWQEMEGREPLFNMMDSFGNDTTGGGTDPVTGEALPIYYANEFSIIQVFAKASFDAGLPVAVYGDYLVNTEADDDDTGYIFGATLGKAKDPGSVQLDYNYRELQANATVGAYSDSDSWGGGTDGKGHRVELKVQVAKNWQLAATYFVNEAGLDEPIDYERGQLDLIGKF